jgi:hypothetical protein
MATASRCSRDLRLGQVETNERLRIDGWAELTGRDTERKVRGCR